MMKALLMGGTAAAAMAFLVTSTGGCASAAKEEPVTPAKSAPADAEIKAKLAEVETLLRELSSRFDTIDVKVAGLNEKVNATRVSLDNLMHTRSVKTESVQDTVDAGRGAPVEKNRSDREGGFVKDAAMRAYRDGLILFEAEKYPEAILEFSGFLKEFPDHPLAGSAQFYVGDAYFRQKEFKLALDEFKRVLIAYENSPHVPDTLRRMIQAETVLKRDGEVGRHRHMLLSLFPHSPAARGVSAPPARAERDETGNGNPEPDAPAPDAKPSPPTAPMAGTRGETT